MNSIKDRNKIMGVINITPDSFSDGGLYDQQEAFIQKFKSVSQWASIIDLGAESTAPFNDPIDAYTELSRYENIFSPILDHKDLAPKILSIDTYRPEIFYELYHLIKKAWPRTKLIFNDISGCIDDDLIYLLSDSNLKFDYIYCHNLCPQRDLASDHMNYCSDIETVEFIEQMGKYIKNAMEILRPLGKKVWVDPCFGFSKTRRQNQLLLKFFKTFLLQLPWDTSVVYGVSRKSFLRFPKNLNVKDPENQKILDQEQAILIFDLIKDNLPHQFIFRMHEDKPLKSALNLMNIFAQ